MTSRQILSLSCEIDIEQEHDNEPRQINVKIHGSSEIRILSKICLLKQKFAMNNAPSPLATLSLFM